jgi:hypothetical protein
VVGTLRFLCFYHHDDVLLYFEINKCGYLFCHPGVFFYNITTPSLQSMFVVLLQMKPYFSFDKDVFLKDLSIPLDFCITKMHRVI